jgi:hypothetical protein
MSSNDPNQERPLKLSPEQEAMVMEALAARERGEPTYSAEEVMEYARKKVREWLPGETA